MICITTSSMPRSCDEKRILSAAASDEPEYKFFSVSMMDLLACASDQNFTPTKSILMFELYKVTSFNLFVFKSRNDISYF